MDRRKVARTLFLVVILGALAAAVLLGDWFSIARLKESRDWLVAFVEARPATAIAGYFLICVVATACCFPAAPIVGLAAGALFGRWPALAVVLAGSSLGSTIAFLNARYLLRSWVEERFADRLAPIDRGFERHGAFYLLALRFNPLIPYWLVNLAIGAVTRMRLAAYVPLTVVGLVPATFIYADAGTRLATLERIGDILSPGLIAALLVLSLFPLIADRLGGLLDRARSGA